MLSRIRQAYTQLKRQRHRAPGGRLQINQQHHRLCFFLFIEICTTQHARCGPQRRCVEIALQYFLSRPADLPDAARANPSWWCVPICMCVITRTLAAGTAQARAARKKHACIADCRSTASRRVVAPHDKAVSFLSA